MSQPFLLLSPVLTLSYILPFVPSGTQLRWVCFPSLWFSQYLLEVSYLKLQRFRRKRGAKAVTVCLCPMWFLYLGYLGDSVLSGLYLWCYLCPALFPVHTHQHHCKLLVCAVVWKYRCTHRPEGFNISCFLTATTRIKLSVDELPSPAMGRSTFPCATALDRRSHRFFSESVSASQPEWRVSFPFPAPWMGIFMVPRTTPASWRVVPGEKPCTRLALSPAQSCCLLIPQDLSGFSMSSETLASKYLQPMALAPYNLEDAHSWSQCFTWCSCWKWQQHKLPSPEQPSTPSGGAPSPTSSSSSHF